MLSVLVLLGCILFPFADAARDESHAIVKATAPLPPALSSNCYTKLVAYGDGHIAAVDEQSGNTCWSFYSGAPSSLFYEVEPEKDEEYPEISGIKDPFVKLLEPDKDLHEYLKELIDQSPILTGRDVFMGSRSSTLFVLNPETGELIRKFEVNGSSKHDINYNSNSMSSIKPLYVLRTDYTAQLFNVANGIAVWNASFAEIGRLSEDGEENDMLNMLPPSVEKIRVPFPATYIPMLISDSSPESSGIELHSIVPSMDAVPALPGTRQTGVKPNGYSTEWLVGGFISTLALLCVLLNWIISLTRGKQNQVPKVKEKRKKKKGQKTVRSVSPSVQDQDGEKPANQMNGTSAGRIRTNVDYEGNRIGNMIVGNVVIGYGSHGTRVHDGHLDGRNVAIKRILRDYYKKAEKEITALIALDAHPNVVRYFSMEEDHNFIYIALEKCSFNLGHLIRSNSKAKDVITTHEQEEERMMADVLTFLQGNHVEYTLWDDQGQPSPLLMKLMRDVVEGLMHLHALGYVHRDLKPQNVLINVNGKIVSAKLSDMGISKRLTEGASSLDNVTTSSGSAGWQAPEQLNKQRQTRSIDMFSLGCILHFCLTGGMHPYGDLFERDRNILRAKPDLFAIEHMPEAMHLISSLLDPDPKNRPSAMAVKLHPFFWNSTKRLSFLIAASDRVEREDREEGSVVLSALEAVAGVAVGQCWDTKLDSVLLENLHRYRHYNYQSIRDILRVIRNKANHYRELPVEVQEVVGAIPNGFESYFRLRFPKLLMEVYKVLSEHCCDEDMFKPYMMTHHHSHHYLD